MVKQAAFDFDIKHRAGRQHGNADGLSRAIAEMFCKLRHEGASRPAGQASVQGDSLSRYPDRVTIGGQQRTRTTEVTELKTDSVRCSTGNRYRPFTYSHFCGGKVKDDSEQDRSS